VYGDASGVSGEKVAQEDQVVYESTDSDNIVMTASIGRHYDESSATTGAMDSNGDTNILKYTAANLSGRIQIAATWFDALNRPTTMAQYGTYNGSDFDRKPSGVWLSAPTASDNTVLVTKTSYGDNGTVYERTAVDGQITRTTYDDAGRLAKQIDNYVNGTPSGANGADDITTLFVYASGHMTKRITDFTGDGETSDDAKTISVYGVAKGSVPDSAFAHGGLLYTVQYPDSSGGGDVMKYAYNAQSQSIYMLTRLTEHQAEYDDSGRKTQTGDRL
jgi:YD repeat-containing protein